MPLPEVEALRKRLQKSKATIEVHDLGAGSKRSRSRRRAIAQIARHTLMPPRKARLLYRLVRYFEPVRILELGTSLGITTLHLAKANPRAKVHTLEGCPQTLAYARAHFEELDCQNIQTHLGDIATTLPEVLKALPRLDFLLLDANHRYAPTLSYFEQCLPRLHENSLVILDDIYWSAEMTRAWHTLRSRPEVSTSIDLFDLGLLFFHWKHPKQHFILKRP